MIVQWAIPGLFLNVLLPSYQLHWEEEQRQEPLASCALPWLHTGSGWPQSSAPLTSVDIWIWLAQIPGHFFPLHIAFNNPSNCLFLPFKADPFTLPLDRHRYTNTRTPRLRTLLPWPVLPAIPEPSKWPESWHLRPLLQTNPKPTMKDATINSWSPMSTRLFATQQFFASFSSHCSGKAFFFFP